MLNPPFLLLSHLSTPGPRSISLLWSPSLPPVYLLLLLPSLSHAPPVDTTVMCGWMFHSFFSPPALEPSNLLSPTAAPPVIYPAAAAAAALFTLNFLSDVCEAHKVCVACSSGLINEAFGLWIGAHSITYINITKII